MNIVALKKGKDGESWGAEAGSLARRRRRVCSAPVSARLGIYLLLAESIHVTIFLSVTVRVFPYYVVRYDPFGSCASYSIIDSVIPYGYIYVDSSYSSLSEDLLQLCHEHRCLVRRKHGESSGVEAEPLARGDRRGSRGVFFFRVCRFGIFCLENPFMSRFSLSVTVIVFP